MSGMRRRMMRMARLFCLQNETACRAYRKSGVEQDHPDNEGGRTNASFHSFKHMSHQGDRLLAVPGPRSDGSSDGSTIRTDEHGRRQTSYHKGSRNVLALIE